MEFKTKFNLEDKVWFMKDNKPTEAIISSIRIFYADTEQNIKYDATNLIDPVSWLDNKNLYENILFNSKDELLKSL